ncbi:hypothetical protein MTR67_024133 [Solanum verrucosum]|uniref:Chromo domain-containing protein n=1 Tax=Solanum verrucosum TaxID=315347 RepID=A0AAF0QWW9_SOLVR|nr:hypothetical protein MTR67_024133 [Solanum verrucosum]
MAYELELPAELVAVHPVFHISLLMKCMGDPTLIITLESVDVNDSCTYEDVPVKILDRQVRRLRFKEVASVKVLWRSQSVKGATWEEKSAMMPSILTSFLLIPFQLEPRDPTSTLWLSTDSALALIFVEYRASSCDY